MIIQEIATQPALTCLKSTMETITVCAISSKLTINTAERRHWLCLVIFVVNFEQISPIDVGY